METRTGQDSLSDKEILRRVQRGEWDLYMELFDRYYGRVEHYARSQVTGTANDLASETFALAYHNVASCHVRDISYLGYLLRICRQLVLVTRTNLPGVPHYSPNEDEVKGHGDTVDSVLGDWQRERRVCAVRGALQGLPAEDREVIFLAYEPGLSRLDIMTILELPSFDGFTVHLYRAIQKLKAMVSRWLPENDDADVDILGPMSWSSNP